VENSRDFRPKRANALLHLLDATREAHDRLDVGRRVVVVEERLAHAPVVAADVSGGLEVVRDRWDRVLRVEQIGVAIAVAVDGASVGAVVAGCPGAGSPFVCAPLTPPSRNRQRMKIGISGRVIVWPSGLCALWGSGLRRVEVAGG